MNKLEKEKQFERALKIELFEAIENEVVGERFEPMLGRRIQTLARGILLRHGLGKARIEVSPAGAGFSVKITLPPKGPRVGVIHISMGQDGPF